MPVIKLPPLRTYLCGCNWPRKRKRTRPVLPQWDGCSGPAFPGSGAAGEMRPFFVNRIRSSAGSGKGSASSRSEEHTSELQSQFHLVCRLLLEKKKKKKNKLYYKV